MIDPSISSESSDVVATRDPPLGSRPESTSNKGGSYLAEPQRRPRPHRGFAVPESQNWNENNAAQPSTEPKKCCFPCFPFRQQGSRHLASHSAGAVANNITSTPPSPKVLLTIPSTNFVKSLFSYPSKKSDLARGASYFGGANVFDFTELEAATNNFDPSRELGKGGFGTVYYGVLPDGCEVAVKKMHKNCFNSVEHFMNEVKTMTQLKHTNLVRFYGCTSSDIQDFLVYEYIPNGTVADHLHGKHAKYNLLSWPVRLSIAVEAASALAYLHKSDTIHQGVKTDNILIEYDFHAKVANFGLSRLFSNGVTDGTTALVGTPGYIDPEYSQCDQVSEKSDVFSFGVVLIELISSQKALDFKRQPDDVILSSMAINKIQNGTLHELVDANLGFETDSNVRRMVTLVAVLAFRCLQQESGMRPSMEQLLGTLKWIQTSEPQCELLQGG